MVTRRGFVGLSASSLTLGALGLVAAPATWAADPTDPVPTPTDPSPTPTDPSPTPTDPSPTPTDPSPTPTPTDPVDPVDPEPPPVSPELITRTGSYRGLRNWLATMSRPGFAGSAGLGVITDSTGTDTSAGDGPGWITQLGAALAAQYPWLSIRSRMWDQTACTYGDATTVQVGTRGLTSASFTSRSNGYLFLPGAGRRVTSDLSVRIKLATNSSRPLRSMHLLSLCGAGGTADLAFDLVLTAGNGPQLRWSPDGRTEVVVQPRARIPFSDNVPFWIRCDLDADDGAGNCVVRFSTRTRDTDPWTQVVRVVRPGTTAIQCPAGVDAGTIPYIVGGFQSSSAANSVFVGDIYEIDVRAGLGENTPSILPRLPAQWRCALSGGATMLAGGPTLEIVGGAWGGHGIRDFVNTTHNSDSRWTTSDAKASFGQDNSALLVPDYGQLVTVLSTSHNDANLENGDIVAYWDRWLSVLRSRLPLSALAVATGNPALPAFGSYRVSAQRLPVIAAWAARNGLTVVDSYQAFLEHPEWTEADGGTLVNAGGVHPTSYGHAQVNVPIHLAAITAGA